MEVILAQFSSLTGIFKAVKLFTSSFEFPAGWDRLGIFRSASVSLLHFVR